MSRKWLFKLVVFTFFILYLRLFYLQVVKGNYFYKQSKNNWLRAIPVSAMRGKILDRFGRELATSKISFNLEIYPNQVEDFENTMTIISKSLNISKKELKRIFRKYYHAPFYPVTLLSDISKREALSLSERFQDLSGVTIVAKGKRFYPLRKVGAHLIGYIGEISSSEYKNLKPYGYQVPSILGKDGTEKVVDPYLKGEKGGILLQIDRKGRERRKIAFKIPLKGHNIYLTIDFDLEKYLQEIFEDKKGSAIAMNPKTGEILALVSSPSYDPNLFISKSEKLKYILKDKNKPLLNRAIQASYQLGSIFKLVVAIAGLETGKLSPSTKFYCSGTFNYGNRQYHCWKEEGHGIQDLREAIVHSCSIYFYQAGLKVGIDDIYRYAKLFGFGEKTKIALPAENKGILPNRKWKKLNLKTRWYPGDTINTSIGQGYLLATPLQVARFISAIANGGYLVKPVIFRAVDNMTLENPYFQKLQIKKSNLNFIKKAMRDVVNDPTGTGQRAKLKEIIVCGKTATAQTPGGKTHAWFAGFAPYRNPEIVIVVMVEHGGQGGRISADIAKGFLEYYFSKKNAN
jgi:penicillin-binding protein 2